jgi:hypothetical protein
VNLGNKILRIKGNESVINPLDCGLPLINHRHGTCI